MSTTNIPAVLKRLGELHAIYCVPGASWWTRWDTKRRAFRYLMKYGAAILAYIAAQDAAARSHADAIAKARRQAFQSGRWEEHKYLIALSRWKKTKKGKMPKEPKPL